MLLLFCLVFSLTTVTTLAKGRSNVVTRTWEVSASSDDRLRLRGPSDDGGDEIRIRTEVSTDNDEAFRYRIDYYPDQIGNAGFKTEFTVKVMNPIQFTESGETPGFQPSEDTITSETRGTPAPLQTQTSEGSLFTWQTNFTNALGMRGYLSDKSAELPDSPQMLSANELKFDLWLENLVWDAQATHLAFHLKLECDSDDIPIDQTRDDSFTIGPTVLGGPAGFFTWDLGVDTFDGPLNSAGGVPANLLFTQSGGELYYTVDTASKPASVMWDPLAGLDVAPAGGLSTGAIVGIVLGVVFAFAIAGFFYRRRSAQKREQAEHPNLIHSKV